MSRVSQEFGWWTDELMEILPTMSEVYLEERDDASDGGRHYAYCTVEAGAIIVVVSPEMNFLSLDTIHGLVLHELGHAIDFAHDTESLENLLGVELSNDPEERADQLVEYVFGETIQYEMPDLVQCVGATCQGGSRPKGLR